MSGLLADDAGSDDDLDLILGGDAEDETPDAEDGGEEQGGEETPEAQDADDGGEGEDETADEEDEDADDEPAERMFTVKVDGRAVQVPESELIRGYAGQAYIQRGLQANAAARKETEALYTALRHEREQFVQFVQPLIRGEVPLARPVPPAPEMATTDPIGYVGARAKYDADVQTWVQTQQQLQTQMERQAEIDAAMQEQHAREQLKVLLQRMPEFTDPQRGKALRDSILRVGTETYGYAPEELSSVVDPRAIQVLADAARWREYQAAQGQLKAKTATPKQGTLRPALKPGPVQKPSAMKGKQRDRVREQMRRTGDVDDVAKFLIG